MSLTRAHLPNPIASRMTALDLHVGCIADVDTATRVVAIMLQPPDALLNEHKVGHILKNWDAVYEVIAGLLDQGALAWGPDPRRTE